MAGGMKMLVRDKMQPSVITITPDQSLWMAKECMRKHGIRRLPVVQHRKLVGIVTDRDVRQAWASLATSLSIHELMYLLDRVTVGETMASKVVTVMPDTPLVKAARLLHDCKIGGLPVMEGEAVVGILTETDLLEVLIELLATQGQALATAQSAPKFPGPVPFSMKVAGPRFAANSCATASQPAPFLPQGVLRCAPPIKTSLAAMALLTEDYATTPAAGARILYTTTMPTGPPPAMRR